MKEITRIHIAKVSYDIEIAAKKQLETYLEAIALYADDPSVLEDIEIRMTELLKKRAVAAHGVITTADVDSLKTTLGEPQAFVSDEDDADVTVPAAKKGRPLYRDIDHALLGGVLAGIARYLGINDLWVRLAFIVLTFISFGLAAIVYAFLWVLTPAAVSIAEKLQMRGESVTVPAIRRFAEGQQGVATKELIRLRRRTFGVIIGVLASAAAITIAAFTAAAVVYWLSVIDRQQETSYPWLILSLMIAAGLFATLAAVLVAIAGFKAHLSKKAIILNVILIALSVATAGSGVALVGYESWQRQEAVQRSITERPVTLPTTFGAISDLTIDAGSTTVIYQVSDTVTGSIVSVPGVTVDVRADGEFGTVTVRGGAVNGYFGNPTITLYGPQLSTMTVASGNVRYEARDQDLSVSVKDGSSATLSGRYTTLIVKDVEASSTLYGQDASIRSATVTQQAGSEVTLGTVESLTITHPTVCPSYQTAVLNAVAVTADTYSYNGRSTPAVSMDDPCGSVLIDPDYMSDGSY